MWPGPHAQQRTGTTTDSFADTARQVLESIGEAALVSLLDPPVYDPDDVEPGPDPSTETVDPCQTCPLDNACGQCAGYGGYACRDNPSRVLDRCVSTAPRNVEPL
jgi:hypothetical protein